MPLQATSGAASYDAFGGGAPSAVNYIEDVFSTYLYTGTGAALTITNGIDLSTKGGLVWIKGRSLLSNHRLVDTVRGAGNKLSSDNTAVSSSQTDGLTAFTSSGFSLGTSAGYNNSGDTYASWTFRKQPKFFDIVTWTGNGASNRAISHSLGSVPGCIIIKRTSLTSNWGVYHRSLTSRSYWLNLNTTEPEAIENNFMDADPTSTTFTVGAGQSSNANSQTYIAYIYAHNAGGFGLTGTDNVISCGSYTTGAGGVATVNLGYEPQWVLAKYAVGSSGDWYIFDGMRGFNLSSDSTLSPNLSAAESTIAGGYYAPNATGFTDGGWFSGSAGAQIIYIAIRRGPMKVPTSGTSVFAPQVYSSGSSPAFNGLSFSPDTAIQLFKAGAASAEGQVFGSKLQGAVKLEASSTAIEAAEGDFIYYQNGFRAGSANSNYAAEMFVRAPNFHDVVCYTGTGTATTVTHNLGVVPELIIVKRRNAVSAWDSYSATLANTEYIVLNTTAAKATGSTRWNSTTPTSSVFSVGTSTTTNASAGTYVAYLFATCAGVSKVGSYTGTGALQTVNCGFTSGARFVLIKRTDSTGDWWTYDSARGISSGNDPYLFLNSTAAEVTSTNYVDTDSTGFKVTAAAPAGLNASGGTFIFLAIS
jgi:hypothetical protein